MALALGGVLLLATHCLDVRAQSPAGKVTSRVDLPNSLTAGSRFTLGGKEVIVRKLDSLPLIDNEYSQVFTYDTSENPRLKELRSRYELDKVVADGKDEFDRQVRLMDWVFHRFKKFGTPTSEARGALAI
jgi:hypothetical protein